jgi:outer membrane lipoprotein-sorting protein
VQDPAVPAAASPDGVEAAAEDARFAARLAKVDAAMAAVADLRAEFEQRRHTPLLKKPLVSKGTVATKGPRVRWDTTSPRASVLLVGDGLVRLFYPADNLVEEYPAGEGFQDLAGAPLPRLSVLKERFDITQIATSELAPGDESADHLAIELKPKSESLRSHVTSVRVLIDESQPAAIRVVMTDAEGERTEIEFTNVKLNQGVKAEDLELKLPEGVRVSRPLGDRADETKKPADAAPADPNATGGKP